MKVIYNSIIPIKGFVAINILGIVFARKEYKPLSKITVRHENIHSKQILNLLFVGFYIWYMIEWFIKLFSKGNAYSRISFERQAYENQDNPDFKYKHFSFLKYIWK